MVLLCVAGCLGRHSCVRLLSGVLAPTGIHIKRYSQDTSDRDVSGQFVCYHLPHRTVLKIQGQDTSPFLQGIITNDTGLLEEPGHSAIYSHMLNVKGRTLYDIMLYRYRTSWSHVMSHKVELAQIKGRSMSEVREVTRDDFLQLPIWNLHIPPTRLHNDILLLSALVLMVNFY